MRLWKEFCNPSLKCIRVGHTPRKQRRKLYRKPELVGWGTGVADSVVEQRIVCIRCNEVLKQPKQISALTIHSLSMPGDDMDLFEEHGNFVIRSWR